MLLLVIMTIVILFFWYVRSPFTDPIYVEKSREGKKIFYEATEFKRGSNALSGTVIWGIIPSLLIGSLLGWVLSRFVL